MGQCLVRPNKVNPILDKVNGGRVSPTGESSRAAYRKSPRIGERVTLPPLRNSPPRYRYDHRQSANVNQKRAWHEKKFTSNTVEPISLRGMKLRENNQYSLSNQKRTKMLLAQKIDPFGQIDLVELPSCEADDNDDEWTGVFNTAATSNVQYAANKRCYDYGKKTWTSLSSSNMVDTSENRDLQKEDVKKPKALRKPSTRAEIAHLAVKSQIGFHEQEMMNEKEKEKLSKPQPFWILGDVPIKPTNLPSIEEVQHQMRNIESQMEALLNPEEKYVRRACAFTIGWKKETARSQAPGCAPQRLIDHQKAVADRVRILEKECEVERREIAILEKRIQSLKRKRDPKVDLKILLEKERKHGRKTKREVDSKMKAATERRNEILGERARVAKKQARTELVSDGEVEIAVANKGKQDVKMTNEKREKSKKKKGKSLKSQDKKRQLVRKEHALQKEEGEQQFHTSVEMETRNANDDFWGHEGY